MENNEKHHLLLLSALIPGEFLDMSSIRSENRKKYTEMKTATLRSNVKQSFEHAKSYQSCFANIVFRRKVCVLHWNALFNNSLASLFLPLDVAKDCFIFIKIRGNDEKYETLQRWCHFRLRNQVINTHNQYVCNLRLDFVWFTTRNEINSFRIRTNGKNKINNGQTYQCKFHFSKVRRVYKMKYSNSCVHIWKIFPVDRSKSASILHFPSFHAHGTYSCIRNWKWNRKSINVNIDCVQKWTPPTTTNNQ